MDSLVNCSVSLPYGIMDVTEVQISLVGYRVPWIYTLFWSSIFGVPYACILIDICFFELGKFSSLIVLKIFSVLVTQVCLPLFQLFLDLVFHSVPDFLEILCLRFLDLTFSLIEISIYSIIFLMQEIVIYLLYSVEEACLSHSCSSF